MRVNRGVAALCLVIAACFGAGQEAFAADRAAAMDNAGPSVRSEAPQAGHAYSGNAQSGIYHNRSCRYFTCKACTVRLASPAEARQKSFRACKVCGG